MSITDGYRKTIGDFDLWLTAGSPRYIEVRNDRVGERIRLDLEEARDIIFALTRLLQIADEDPK